MPECRTNLTLMGHSNLNLPVNFLQRLIEGRQCEISPTKKNYQLVIASNEWENEATQKGVPTFGVSLNDFTQTEEKQTINELHLDALASYLIRSGNALKHEEFDPDTGSLRNSGVAFGLIDTGIPFWKNDLGGKESGAYFQSIGFLQFHPSPMDNNDTFLFSEIKQTEIEKFSTKDLDENERFECLGKRFPGSIYGGSDDGATLQPSDFSHGCAMASILYQSSDMASTPIFGIELPKEAIIDSSGETLGFVCAYSIKMLVKLATQNSKINHLVIVLPYGFTGGPHDGSHPIAKSIESALAIPDPSTRISLVLPTGNHLQSQSHAVIKATYPEQETEPLSVIIPPDDYSDNKFDLVTKAFTPPILILRNPNGEKFTVCFDKGLDDLKRNNLWYAKDEMLAVNLQIHDLEICDGDDGANPIGRAPMQFKYQIIIGKTAISPDFLPGTAGEWTISLESSDGRPLPASSCWILRDDMPIAADRMLPRRQAVFVDEEYKTSNEEGLPITNDSENASCIKREGTASVMTTINPATPNIYRVGAAAPGATCPTRANYSGAMIGRDEDDLMRVDPEQADEGTEATINALGDIARVSGTSVAAALKARELALSSK